MGAPTHSSTAAFLAISACATQQASAEDQAPGGQWPRPNPESQPLTNNPLEYDPVTNEHTANMTIARSAALDYYREGRYSKAEARFIEALAEARLGFDKTDPHIASCLNNLAELYRNTGQFDKAEALYREAMEQLDLAYGEKHWLYVSALHNLALCLDGAGKLQAAHDAMQRVMALRLTMFGSQHFMYADAMFALGGMAKRLGGADNKRRALSLMKDAVAILEGAENVQTSVLLAWLSELSAELAQRGMVGDAVACVRKAMYHLGNDKGATPALASGLSDNLVELLSRSGRSTEAVAAMRAAAQARAELFGKQGALVVAQSVLRLAVLEGQLGTAEATEASLRHAKEAVALATANLAALSGSAGGWGRWLTGSAANDAAKQLKQAQAGHILGSALCFCGEAQLKSGSSDEAAASLQQSVDTLQGALDVVKMQLAQHQQALARAAAIVPPAGSTSQPIKARGSTVDVEELANLYVEVQLQLLEAMEQLINALTTSGSSSSATGSSTGGRSSTGGDSAAFNGTGGSGGRAGLSQGMVGDAKVEGRAGASVVERVAALQQRSEALARDMLL